MAANTNLTGSKVKNSFGQLLHIGDTNGVEATAHQLYDGDGTALPIKVSTTAVEIIDGAIDFDIASHDGTNGLKLGGALVTSTATELNIMDGVTATTAELNILDGVTSTASELNILDGVTATATELNYNDITTLGTVEASKAVTADSNKDTNYAGGYLLNEQGRADRSAMPQPYYRFDGVDDYTEIDALAAELVSTSNTKGSIVWCGSIQNITNDEDYIWSFGDTNASEFLAFRTAATDGKLEIFCRKAGTTQYTYISDDVVVSANEINHIVWVQDGTSPALYVNGVSVAITGSSVVDATAWFSDLTGIDNGRLGALNNNSGGDSDWSENQTNSFAAYNKALTAAEVKQLYSGASVPFKYKGASQTEKVTGNWLNAWATATWSTFSSTGSDNFTASHNVDEDIRNQVLLDNAFEVGKSYRVSFDLTFSGASSVSIFGMNTGYGGGVLGMSESFPAISSGVSYSHEFTVTSSTAIAIGFSFYVNNSSPTATLTNFSVTQIGAVAEYDGSTMTGATWYDKSGNNLDGTVSGASLENKVAALDVTDELTTATFTSTGIDDNATSTAITIDASEQVGIGTANPDERFHVTGLTGGPYAVIIQNMDTSGGANQIHFKDGSGDTCGTIVSNATNNTTAYNTSSDYRLKENEVSISDGLERLNQLKPYRFNFISNPDKIKVDGFFAHEVSDIVPEATTGEKDAMKDEEVSPAIQAVEAVEGQEEIAWIDKPTEENTKDEIKAWMDSNSLAYNSGDTKADLIAKIPELQQEFIQSVEAVEAVDAVYESVPDYQGIDQSKLVPLLVAAVQELSAKVEALENK